MIFNNVYKRSSLGLFSILLLCFSLLLSSCANSSGGINDHSLYISNATSAEAQQKTDFYFFIIPKDASASLVQSANGLCEKFCAENGVSARVYFDDEPLPTYNNPRFILIGDTAYASSHKAISDLKRDDYVCLSIGKDVVIGGKSSSATILAIERFTKDVLPYFDGESGISETSSFKFFAEYPRKNITINGYSLSDYTFVYPSEDSMSEMALAYLLREKLSDICGAYPKVVSDKEADETDRLICVGNCFGDTQEGSQIIYQGKSVKIFASSKNVLAKAADTFIKVCESSKDLTLINKMVIDSNIPSISFKSFFADTISNESDLLAVVNTCKEIKQALPLLVYFDFPSADECEQYKKNLGEYTLIGGSLFVLSSKNTVTASFNEELISVADVSVGEGFDYRVITANAYKGSNPQDAVNSAISKISDSVPTVLFTVSSSGEKLSFDRADIVLESENTGNGKTIYITVFSPSGASEICGQELIINHSLLKEAFLLIA